MPIYEYRCTACGGRYEALVAGADRARPHCPRCGAARAERLISTFAVGRAAAEVPAPGPAGSAGCACTSGGCACQRSNREASP